MSTLPSQEPRKNLDSLNLSEQLDKHYAGTMTLDHMARLIAGDQQIPDNHLPELRIKIVGVIRKSTKYGITEQGVIYYDHRRTDSQ